MFEEELLEKVENLLLGKLVKDVQNYSVGGRSLQYFTIAELVTLRDKLKSDIKKIKLEKSLAEKGVKRIKGIRYI